MTASIRTSGFLIGCAIFFAAAMAQAADPKKPLKLTFDEHVQPILRDKCMGCHNQDKSRGGLVVASYTSLMTGGSSGEVVKPGDPDNSRLFLLISHKQQPNMPPKSPMIETASIETIRKWIAEGALENSGSKAKIVNKPKIEIGLSSVIRGKPAGPPPMPTAKLTLEPVVHTARAGALTALACSPWAPLVAVAGQKQALLYHSDNFELLGVLPFPEGIPHVLKFSRNGSLLLAGGGRGGKSGRVVVWSVQSGERIFEVGDESDAVLAADISADQTQIALGGPAKVVRIYSTKDGQLLREIKKHTDWITALEYSPDGVLLASGDRASGLFVWEAFTGREYFNLRGHTAAVTDVSWRIDSNVLASASEDTTIRLWEMENGNPIKSWGAHGGGTLSVRYSQDGRLVSCGRDHVTKIWDQNGTQKIAFEGFPDLALKTAITHDSGKVIAGDWSGLIRVWATADGKRAGELTSNPPTVSERLATLTKDLAARQAEHDKLAAAATAAEAGAKKSAAEAAAAKARLDQSASELAQVRSQADRLKAVTQSVKTAKK